MSVRGEDPHPSQSKQNANRNRQSRNTAYLEDFLLDEEMSLYHLRAVVVPVAIFKKRAQKKRMWEQRWRLSCRATGRGVAQDRDDIKCHQTDSNAIEIFKYHWKETSRKISRRMSDLIDRVMTAKIHCPLLWLVRLINL